MKIPMNIDALTPKQVKELLLVIIEKLDEYDQDDFFGTEGWKRTFGFED